jgi:hypothetical protein
MFWLLQVTYGFSAIPIKMLMTFFKELEKKISLEINMEHKRLQIGKVIVMVWIWNIPYRLMCWKSGPQLLKLFLEVSGNFRR